MTMDEDDMSPLPAEADSPAPAPAPSPAPSDDGEPDMAPIPALVVGKGMPRTAAALTLLGAGQPYNNRNK